LSRRSPGAEGGEVRGADGSRWKELNQTSLRTSTASTPTNKHLTGLRVISASARSTIINRGSLGDWMRAAQPNRRCPCR
jgi:hypothetical protein